MPKPFARVGVTSATRRGLVSVIRVGRNTFRTPRGAKPLNLVRGKDTGFRRLSNTKITKGGRG